MSESIVHDPEATILAIVPARGGSKGIPRKNLADLCGRPLLSWSLDALTQARTGMRIVVSTDDDEIAAVAKESGIEVRTRPAALASDDASTESAVTDVIDHLPGASSIRTILLVQATSPLRRHGTVDRFLDDYSSDRADSLVAVVEASPFLWQGPTDRPTPLYEPSARPRRQDFVESWLLYRECGSLYAFDRAGFEETRLRIFGETRICVLDSLEGIDVDTPDDLELVRLLVGSGTWKVDDQ